MHALLRTTGRGSRVESRCEMRCCCRNAGLTGAGYSHRVDPVCLHTESQHGALMKVKVRGRRAAPLPCLHGIPRCCLREQGAALRKIAHVS